MGEIVGRATCPVCGEQFQDVKVNKNNKIYCYCDNRCKWQLNSKYSRIVLAALRGGRAVRLEKVGIISAIKDNLQINQSCKRDDLEEELDI